jgi:hypothetical protein
MDPATFAATRLLAGPSTLSLWRRAPRTAGRAWISGPALVSYYVGCFSFAATLREARVSTEGVVTLFRRNRLEVPEGTRLTRRSASRR